MIKNNLITLHIKRKQLPIFYLFFFIFLLSSGNSRLYAEENRAFNLIWTTDYPSCPCSTFARMTKDIYGLPPATASTNMTVHISPSTNTATGITIPCQTIISPNYFRTTYAEGFGWVPITDWTILIRKQTSSPTTNWQIIRSFPAIAYFLSVWTNPVSYG